MGSEKKQKRKILRREDRITEPLERKLRVYKGGGETMIDQVLLTAVQSRILVVLLMREGGLGTASLLKLVGISGKTWSKERRRLENLGLLTTEEQRGFSKSGVRVMAYHRLTPKGIDIASGILEISNSLSSGESGKTVS